MTTDAADQLEGLKVLLVEDEAFIAMELEDCMTDAGATVIGPIASLSEALKTCKREDFDVAILDIMLGRKEVFPVADILAAQGVDFVFHSAHAEPEKLASRYPDTPLISKPSMPENITKTLAELVK